MVKTLRGDISVDEINHMYKGCYERKLKEKLLAIKMLYSGYRYLNKNQAQINPKLAL